MIALALPLSFLKSSASCLSVTISFMLTTLRCLSCRRILISLMAVMGKPSFSLSKRTFFKATSSPVQSSKKSTVNTRNVYLSAWCPEMFPYLCLCPWPCRLGHRCPPQWCLLYQIYLHNVCPSHSVCVCVHHIVGNKSCNSKKEESLGYW